MPATKTKKVESKVIDPDSPKTEKMPAKGGKSSNKSVREAEKKKAQKPKSKEAKAKAKKANEAKAAASKPKPKTDQEKLAKREERELSLYEYRKIIAEVEESIDPETGEISEEAAAKLVAAQQGSIVKLKNLVWYMRQMGTKIAGIDDELKRLNALKAWAGRKVASLTKALLQFTMEQPKQKLDLDTYMLTAAKCPASVNLEEDFFDAFYCTPTVIKNPTQAVIDFAKAHQGKDQDDKPQNEVQYQPDKKAIKEALQEEGSEPIPGASLITDKRKLRIK